MSHVTSIRLDDDEWEIWQTIPSKERGKLIRTILNEYEEVYALQQCVKALRIRLDHIEKTMAYYGIHRCDKCWCYYRPEKDGGTPNVCRGCFE